jgi:asparagine synthase (glutamine-hydrolysing)
MVDRPKEGFLMPVTQWMLNDLGPYVRETLSEERLRRHGFFDAGRVTALVDRLGQPGADYTDVNRVLGLVVFQEWYDLYMR